MDIFTTALGLTKQENGYALTRYLVERLHEEFQPSQASVFEVFGIPGNYSFDAVAGLQDITIRRFDYEDSSERIKTDVSQYLSAIKSGHPVIAHPDTSREDIAIPIASQHGPFRMLIIDDISESPQRRTQLFQVSELYASLIALHDSHERDPLTGLLNRQTFNHIYERTAHTCKKQQLQMFLAVFDIDHFKRVNDSYGHLFGDEVLLQFAQLMQNSFRYNDALFRFGGEEFIALIKCETSECAEHALNRFRTTIEQHEFPRVGQITVSIGYAEASVSKFPNTVIGHADTALYHAKEHGRNQVVDYRNIHPREPATEGEIDLF